MKMARKINLGTALRFMSYLLYEAGEALQRAGDALGDAGDSYEAKAPRAKARAKETMERAAGAAWTAAGVLGGGVAFCLALGYRRAACMVQGMTALASAYKVLFPLILDGIRKGAWQAIRAGKAGAATFYRAGQRARQSLAGAWAFREAILTEGRA